MVFHPFFVWYRFTLYHYCFFANRIYPNKINRIIFFSSLVATLFYYRSTLCVPFSVPFVPRTNKTTFCTQIDNLMRYLPAVGRERIYIYANAYIKVIVFAVRIFEITVAMCAIVQRVILFRVLLLRGTDNTDDEIRIHQTYLYSNIMRVNK